MDDRDRQHLRILVGHAQAATGYARARGRGWWKNPETLDAVLMRISQVGEAASRTSPEALAAVPGVTWRDVKGIRGKIVHDYQAVDTLVIRGVVSRQLPRLIAIVGKALAAEAEATKLGNATSTTPARSSQGPVSPGSRPPGRRPPA
jgi:uncharacterized protein with HEPN domain